MPIPSSTSSRGEAIPILGAMTLTATITAIPIIPISSRSMAPSSRRRGRLAGVRECWRTGPRAGGRAARAAPRADPGWSRAASRHRPAGAGGDRSAPSTRGRGCPPDRRRWWPAPRDQLQDAQPRRVTEGAQGRGEARPVQLHELVGVTRQLPADRSAVDDQGPRVRHRPRSDALLEPFEDPEGVGLVAGGPRVGRPAGCPPAPPVAVPARRGRPGRSAPPQGDRGWSPYDFT